MGVEHPEKTSLRNTLRERRRNLTSAQSRNAAALLLDTLSELPHWQAAEHIALYLPNDREIDPHHIAQRARQLDKKLYLPVIEKDKTLTFRRWKAETKLVANRFGIDEPPLQAARRNTPDLDIIFMPLVGWDSNGNRLGMGGGFYDRTLAGIDAPLRVGLAYECQRVDKLVREHWDIQLHYIATENNLYSGQTADTTG